MASFLTDTNFVGNVLLGDDTYIKIGASSDLQIHHSSVGSGSTISETGPGALNLFSDTGVVIKSGVLGENFANFTKDGPIELYYDNSKKFETTSAGVSITGVGTFSGTVTANGVTLTGTQTTVSGNAGSATVLQTARTIAGVSFNGSANISLNNNAITNGAGYTTNAGTVTQVNVGTGLDVSNATTSPTVSLDLSELNDIDGDDPQITDFVVVSNEDESARCSLANTKIALGANKSQFVLNSNFSDDSSTTSYIYMPFNSISDTTSAQYYVHWAAPCTGRIKRIIMQHVYGSMSSGFTTQLQVYKGGSTFTTSGELTATSTNDGGYIEYNPTGSNVEFVKGDRIRIRYSKNTTSKYWRGVAASIIMELDQV